jgi:hypothetical protein
MRVFGEGLTFLVCMSGLGLAAVAAGVGLDAWWLRCEAMERRHRTGDGHADATE